MTNPLQSIRLAVADDGAGFDRTAIDPGRLGIVGMRERAAAIGAELEVHSELGGGTRIGLMFPASLLEGAEAVL